MPGDDRLRDMDDDSLNALLRRAAQLGPSAPDYRRQATEQIAASITVAAWVERTRRRTMPGRRVDTLATLEDLRGPWPV